MHTDWKQNETASLALSGGNRLCYQSVCYVIYAKYSNMTMVSTFSSDSKSAIVCISLDVKLDKRRNTNTHTHIHRRIKHSCSLSSIFPLCPEIISLCCDLPSPVLFPLFCGCRGLKQGPQQCVCTVCWDHGCCAQPVDCEGRGELPQVWEGFNCQPQGA